MPNDPISTIKGEVVGMGLVSNLLGKIPAVGPELKKGADIFRGKDFNDAPIGQTVGAEGGMPIEAGGEAGGAAAAAEAIPIVPV